MCSLVLYKTFFRVELSFFFLNNQRSNIDELRVSFKGTLSGLPQLLAIESSLKKMKNAFYFTSKTLFLLKIFKFLFLLFGLVAKRLDKKDKVNFKFYDVTTWLTNNCNTHTAQYLEK